MLPATALGFFFGKRPAMGMALASIAFLGVLSTIFESDIRDSFSLGACALLAQFVGALLLRQIFHAYTSIGSVLSGLLAGPLLALGLLIFPNLYQQHPPLPSHHALDQLLSHTPQHAFSYLKTLTPSPDIFLARVP